MAMLSFLPWKTFDKQLTLGQFLITPYKLGSNTNYDQVLSNFHFSDNYPIRSATIISVAQFDPIEDIGGNLLVQMFEFGEILAFSFLSSRKLFSDFDYSNYHSLKMIVQKFKPNNPGISIASRRRDGSSWSHLFNSSAITKAPHHVNVGDTLKLDEALCLSLLKYTQEDDRPILESLYSYLQANTDSPDVTLHSELVLICGSIESVLEIKNGSTEDLVQAFCEQLDKVLAFDIELSDCEKFKIHTIKGTHKKAKNLREVWIKDFYITRGDMAHGRREPKYPSVWTMQEHIILASEVFPLLVKIKLHELKLYLLTDSDYEKIFFFDHRLSVSSLMKVGESHGTPIFGWNKAIEEEVWNWSFKKDDLINKSSYST